MPKPDVGPIRRRVHKPSNRQREALLARIEQLTELPLLVVSFIMIPILVGPFVWDLSTAEKATFASINALIWIAFAADLAFKLSISTHRIRYLKSHWLEVLIVVIPVLRPLRIIAIILYGSRAFRNSRRLGQTDFLLVYAAGMVVLAATIVTTVEHDASGATIGSFADALWWSLVTVTTVGYGDFTPVTATGRAVAAVLMVGGIGFFSGLAANFAAILIHSESRDNAAEIVQAQETITDLDSKIGALSSQIENLTKKLDRA
jgi:voltage-gated potassium channel